MVWCLVGLVRPAWPTCESYVIQITLIIVLIPIIASTCEQNLIIIFRSVTEKIAFCFTVHAKYLKILN